VRQVWLIWTQYEYDSYAVADVLSSGEVAARRAERLAASYGGYMPDGTRRWSKPGGHAIWVEEREVHDD